MTELDDSIQVRKGGELVRQITVDAHELVVMTIWHPDGDTIESRLKLPAKTARRLAAELLSAADAADQAG